MADSAAYKYLANNETTTAPSTEHPPAVEKVELKKPNDTLMTAMMTVTKSTVHKCTSFLEDVQKSQAYKVMFFVQPAHVIMMLAVTLVAASMLPNNIKRTSNANGEIKPRSFVNFVYLAAFCTHVGAQFWMTFISGLSLYFNLTRHAFGDVQRILFPKYFSLNSVLSAITLIQFSKIHVAANMWDVYTYTQLFVLSLCFLLELVIRLYAVPPLLRLISMKMAIEKSAGVGTVVGNYDLGRLVDCPHYMAIHRAFRQVHLCVAMGNVITMMCTSFHLMYIAS